MISNSLIVEVIIERSCAIVTSAQYLVTHTVASIFPQGLIVVPMSESVRYRYTLHATVRLRIHHSEIGRNIALNV